MLNSVSQKRNCVRMKQCESGNFSQWVTDANQWGSQWSSQWGSLFIGCLGKQC